MPPIDPQPPRAFDEQRSLQTGLLVVIAFAIIMFLLVQAQFLLISLAIAIILFSLTSDAINTISRVRIGKARFSIGVASFLAVILIATVLLTLSAIILSQANTVVFTIMQYAEPTQKAVAELFSWMGEDVEAAVLNWMRQIQVGDYLRTAAGQAGNILSGTVLVILFVGFLFLERLWFSTKLTNLFGDAERAARVERIISSIIHRVNRYLLVKALVSFVTGILVYGVMSGFGLELATAMGVLTFVLNFIPNIGSIVATVATAMVAYVQSGDTVIGLAVLSLVMLIQFVIGQVLDPLLLGRALRLSSFGIIISLAFWAAVWGIPGMFLAVPIMVAMMIVCSHIPLMRPVAVLLSREGLPDTELDLDSATKRAPQ
ncbi:MAG: AI-2E family transporter [Gemmobacter sp.]|nr:AI-2E family transporter [Gemmobacter sp.]